MNARINSLTPSAPKRATWTPEEKKLQSCALRYFRDEEPLHQKCGLTAIKALAARGHVLYVANVFHDRAIELTKSNVPAEVEVGQQFFLFIAESGLRNFKGKNPVAMIETETTPTAQRSSSVHSFVLQQSSPAEVCANV